MLDATPEERARAAVLVHEEMLHALFVHVLALGTEPVETAEAMQSNTLVGLEALLSHTAGRDASVTSHIAIDRMERLWKRIIAELRSHDDPIPFVPRDFD